MTVANFQPAISLYGSKDELDRFYTPVELAFFCVRLTQFMLDSYGVDVRSWREPHVGGGAIGHALAALFPSATGFVSDVDPSAHGLTLAQHANRITATIGDYLDPAVSHTPVDLTLGNPPFSGKNAMPHLWRALTHSQHVAFILPWSYPAGAERWKPLMRNGFNSLVFIAPLHPRPWGDSLREPALFIFSRVLPALMPSFTGPIVLPTPRWRLPDLTRVKL